jgi:hypothetical protein
VDGFDFYTIGFAVVGVRDVHLDSSAEAVFGSKAVLFGDPDHLFVEVFCHFGSPVAVCGKWGLTFKFNYQGIKYADQAHVTLSTCPGFLRTTYHNRSNLYNALTAPVPVVELNFR